MYKFHFLEVTYSENGDIDNCGIVEFVKHIKI